MNYIFRELAYAGLRVWHKVRNKTLKTGFRCQIPIGSKFEGYNKVDHHAYFSGRMGYGSYIGEYSSVVGKIGKYCSIGGHVVFICPTHPVKKFVSTAPCFYSLAKQNGMTYVDKQKFNEFPKYEGTDFPIIVGNDVYIGYGATIIAPVKIGDGAVIAANAVVTHDVEPYTIVGGCPAKTIRKRFRDDQIEFLLSFQWWNRERNWIRAHSDLFEDIDKLMENGEK